MSNKIYLSAQQQLEDGFALGQMIYESNFRPDYIVAIWRGGAPIGIAVQELLAWRGIKTDHIAIRTSSYGNAIDRRQPSIKISGLEYLYSRVNSEDSLLFVDDVFDTGFTMTAVIEELRSKARLNTPDDIRIAVPWYKPDRRQVTLAPDFHLRQTDQWIKFPHSLEGLSDEEIATNRPEIWSVLNPSD